MIHIQFWSNKEKMNTQPTFQEGKDYLTLYNLKKSVVHFVYFIVFRFDKIKSSAKISDDGR